MELNSAVMEDKIYSGHFTTNLYKTKTERNLQ